MRLLFIAERFPPDPGGVANSARRTVARLEELGCEVDVLAWSRRLRPGVVHSEEERPGITVHRFGILDSLEHTLSQASIVLEWIHDRRRIEAVFGHWLHPSGFLAVLFGAGRGLPTVVSARGNDVDRLMYPPGDMARLLWTLSRASFVTAVSHDLSRKIRLLAGDDIDVTVVTNAVDTETFRRVAPDAGLRERLGLSTDDVVLGFCGELRRKKGLTFLLEALRRVNETRPARLLVVGQIRERDQDQLFAFDHAYPEVRERIVFSGQITEPEEVNRHLNLIDVYLSPSLQDGVPNALLEAMAAERCVIVSDAGGLVDVVDDGIDGTVVPRHALHHLSSRILEVLALGATERERRGSAARRRMLRNHTLEKERATLHELLEKLRRLCQMGRGRSPE